MLFKFKSGIFKLVLVFLAFYFLSPFLVFGVTIENPITSDTILEFLDRLVVFIFKVAMAVAAIMIVIAGFYFVVAAGDPEKIKKAQKLILWALIGVAVAFLSRVIVNFLLSEMLGADTIGIAF